MACCGDTPTLETLAAVTILRAHLPHLRVRVINVIDLTTLHTPDEHPRGLRDSDYDALFTRDRPIIFAFHGYRGLVHQLVHGRANRTMSVHGYREEGTITTPFDIRVQNRIDRFNLVIDAVTHLPETGSRGAWLVQTMRDRLAAHARYIVTEGKDLPEIVDWRWSDAASVTLADHHALL
jgi:xylulose-5-phosphate/fructose-6-phosphate phosphoketolase